MFFREILQIDKFEGDDFKYDNGFSKNLAQKAPNKAFLVPNLGIFIFSKILQFKGTDFKYEIFFKF